MVQVKFSTCKKAILETNLRASKDAVLKLQEEISKILNEKTKRASEYAIKEKRKTVMTNNIEKAFEIEE